MPEENVKQWKLLIAAAHPASELRVLPVGVRVLIDQADEILVMVPTLPGRLAWLAGEIDKTLVATIRWLPLGMRSPASVPITS
jgi:hypothetical protein